MFCIHPVPGLIQSWNELYIYFCYEDETIKTICKKYNFPIKLVSENTRKFIKNLKRVRISDKLKSCSPIVLPSKPHCFDWTEYTRCQNEKDLQRLEIKAAKILANFKRTLAVERKSPNRKRQKQQRSSVRCALRESLFI